MKTCHYESSTVLPITRALVDVQLPEIFLSTMVGPRQRPDLPTQVNEFHEEGPVEKQLSETRDMNVQSESLNVERMSPLDLLGYQSSTSEEAGMNETRLIGLFGLDEKLSGGLFQQSRCLNRESAGIRIKEDPPIDKLESFMLDQEGSTVSSLGWRISSEITIPSVVGGASQGIDHDTLPTMETTLIPIVRNAKTSAASSQDTHAACDKRGAPKNALHAIYGKYPRNVRTEKADYFTWSEGPLHERIFSSIFVDPVTGEIFPTGRYGDFTAHVTKVDPRTGLLCIYYKKKILAEHGAAARAYDCLLYRDFHGDETFCDYLGHEDPSVSPNIFEVPSMVPEEMKKAIYEAQRHTRGPNVRNKSREPQAKNNDFSVWERRSYEVDTLSDFLR